FPSNAPGSERAHRLEFAYDIFVSYARLDNEADELHVRWVSDFCRNLTSAVRQRLAREVTVFFSSMPDQENSNLSTLQAVQQSAIFIALCSSSYAREEWTARELETFQNARRMDGLFVVELSPMQERDYPPSLRDRRRIQFWVLDDEERPVKLSPRH